MSKQLAKKTISAAQSVFDSAAIKTVTSPVKDYVASYVELTRADDYSGTKRIVDKYMEFAEKRGLPQMLKPNDPAAAADRFSRVVGSMDSLKSFRKAWRYSKKAVGYAALGLAGLTAYSPETGLKILDWVKEVGLGALVPVVGIAAVIISARFVHKSFQIHGMHRDAQFAANAQKDGSTLFGKGLEKLGKALDNESYREASNAWITKQCEKHEKKYHPDFSPESVETIRQGLSLQQSEAVMVSPFTAEQQKAVKKISKALREEYFVPDHLATKATLTLLVESGGNSKAVAAMLNSRRIEQSVIDRFGIDPVATYGGKRQEPIKPAQQLPAPIDADASPSP